MRRTLSVSALAISLASTALFCPAVSAQNDDGPDIIRHPSVESPGKSKALLTVAAVIGGLVIAVLPAVSPSKRGHKD
ncbi:MAG: hypothetical protein AAGI30_05040 [Planctomycetota bacterium]